MDMDISGFMNAFAALLDWIRTFFESTLAGNVLLLLLVITPVAGKLYGFYKT